ncbi:divergent polysaccharide deacetylase family protein [Campylobacter sp. US33a]|uniref:divergent polysaccharide deacetylase family protein n=1 Tax=Campylobacter sp. US33a TaxID=2498120 RepID=UPI001FB94821|nr:divergent polysaccharide deacetylase family protein [Campylobacter sp. US33a]
MSRIYLKKGQIIIIALVFIVLFVSLVYFGYKNNKNTFTIKSEFNITYENKLPAKEPTWQQNKQISEANFSEFENAIFEDFNLSENLQKDISKDLNASDLNNTLVIKDQNSSLLKPQKDSKVSQKAKLVIIIDDIVSFEQLKDLQETKLKLTPSLMPKDKSRPSSAAKFAKNLDFYMVHLPLAAINYANEEKDTLYPQDSEEKIENKIQQIKKDFKNIKYINNHTGSLFTSDEKAMRKLLKIFKKYDLIFVDSKTIGKSVTTKIIKDFSQPLIQRDVFLDNEDSVVYVKKQLESAVKLAQKKGFAIAIAHPRKNTFKALKESEKLLRKVELVYLSEIYGK